MEFLWFAMGLVVGGVVAALALHARHAAGRAAMEARLAAEREAQEAARQQLAQTFNALAAEALRSNNESFLHLAQQALEARLMQAQGDLDLRRQAVEELVKPLAETLKEMERERQQAYGGLRQLAQAMLAGQETLARETRTLVQALRAPQVRGRWGEVTLRRVVELAGLVERCDFLEQQTLEGEGSWQRPDMVVTLPSGRRIVVDAKTPLEAYLQSMEAATEEARSAALRQHARLVRERVRQLASKAYWAALEGSPEFVVLFLPGEAFLGPALAEDPDLLAHALRDRVVLATPTTLVSLLHAVAYGWRQEQMAENARRVSDLGRELYERLATWAGHLERLGSALDRAVDAYNDSVGSLETRVLVSARRMRELGVAGEKEVPPLEGLERRARRLAAGATDGAAALSGEGEAG